jgi:hypothetical protein
MALANLPSGQVTFATAGRNIFRGPHYRNWDFSVVKTFRFGERISAQLRGEFFNVLNHTNFGIPGSLLVSAFNNDLSSPGSFGQVPGTPDVVAANPVIGTGGPRNIQLGLKFRFWARRGAALSRTDVRECLPLLGPM